MSETFDFRIGVIGPTGVGKTSLLSGLLAESQALLAGTPVSMTAVGITKRKLGKHQTDLRGSILAGEFNPGGLKGTQELFKFELALTVGASAIQLGFLDYPGSWLDSTRRTAQMEGAWQECEDWIRASSVLLVPIDAAVLMEATLAAHKRAIPDILRFHDVEQVVRSWAKGRNSRPDEPALLVLVPLKCESYFADNGGRRDQSRDLMELVMQHYRETLRIARGECTRVNVLYAPVDTFGCVEIMRAQWKADANARGGVEFSADYIVRHPGELSPKGADALLVALCRHLVEAKVAVERVAAVGKRGEATAKEEEANRFRGLLGEVMAFFTGEKRRLRAEASELGAAADAKASEVEQLENAVTTLATRELGPRARAV